MQICIDCGQELPRSKFHIRNNRKIGIESRCKDCSNAKKREYRKNNKEMIRAQNKRRVPGWDIDRYNEYLELQEGKCGICGTTKYTNKDGVLTTTTLLTSLEDYFVVDVMLDWDTSRITLSISSQPLTT